MSPGGMTIEALRAAYATGLAPQEVIAEVFDRIAACPDPAVWITRRPREQVLREASALPRDARERSPLWGIPFAVKDNIDCAGLPTSSGLPAIAAVPPRDAAVVGRLRAAGALVVGKTNLDQFATGLSGVRSPYGAPRCVFDPTRISGGSSSGSAVAVARGLVPFALGTDTAGSGRVPAAFNNLVGVKPTRGIVSTSGVMPASRSLDCVSVFAASVAEADLVRHVAQGDDGVDPFARRAHVRALRTEPVVGVLADGDRTFFGDDAAATLYARALQCASAAGFRTRTFDFAPFRDAARLLYGSAIVAERLASLEEVLRAHGDALEPALRTILDGARRHSGADVFRAQHTLAALGRRASAVWQDVDLLLLPTAPTLYTVDELLADPIGRNANLGTYTNFVNLLDCCAIAVPAGFTESGLPFGVTVVAPAFADDDLAAIADRVHRLLEPSFGMLRETLPSTTVGRPPLADGVDLVVVGAHLGGEPLNRELIARGATLVATTRTAPGYRLFVIAGTSPAKPGLMRAPGFAGPGIEAEVWRLSSTEFGAFVASVPAPLAIGSIELADGVHAKGFLAEPYALDGAAEITQYGGWRAYRRSAHAAADAHRA